MGASESPVHTVRTTLNYALPLSKGGSAIFYPGTASAKRRPFDAREVEVADIRGRESDFNLDVQGFQVVSRMSREKTFDDDERVKEVYYAECEALIKDVLVSPFGRACILSLTNARFRTEQAQAE